ncbi:MAG: hypothetical protein JXA08_05085 [Methanomicrobiaceae archaeon]|nr:hypothetical protein [Methanomicrobiaceae archaeon]
MTDTVTNEATAAGWKITHAPAPIEGTRRDEIQKVRNLLFGPGDVVEVRVLTQNGPTNYGYFGGEDDIAGEALLADSLGSTKGVYVTINPVIPALLARRKGRILPAGRDSLTGDADIIQRRWLPIDLDAVRPSGISSSDEEHAGAIEKAAQIGEWLTDNGFPLPIMADSGNGAHLLYAIDIANDEAATALIKSCLTTLDVIFSGEAVSVDTTNFNAARIWKLYGTTARKGDDVPDRPHRRAKILGVPDEVQQVPVERLEWLAGLAPKPPAAPTRAAGGGSIDLRAWLHDHGIGVQSDRPYEGGTLFKLERCPFSSAHNDGAFAIQFGNGAIAAGCHHASCQGMGWSDLRAIYDPGREKHAPAAPVARSGSAPPTAGNNVSGAGNPTIYVSGSIPDLTEQALESIRKANESDPHVFARSGEMVALHFDEKRRRVNLAPVTREMLRGVLMRTCEWVKSRELRDGSVEEIPCPPPAHVLDDVLSSSPHTWRLPAVIGVVDVPIVRDDGTIVTDPGYDAATELIYNPTPDLDGFTVPEVIGKEDVDQAVRLLDELLHDFPFLGESDPDTFGDARHADRGNAIAALVTHVARPIISGNVPAYLCDKPQPRTGASLLQEVIYRVLTGSPPPIKTKAASDEEFRKFITTELAVGTTIILMDNIDQGLKTSNLAAVITASAWKDRWMGVNKSVVFENRIFWLINGNNVQLSPDMAQRCFYSRIDAKMARPGERDTNGFLHYPLRTWVIDNRARLLSSVYVLVRAWIIAGRPAPRTKPKLGGFEEWIDVVSGVLDYAGIKGFMANQQGLYASADASGEQWSAFLQALRGEFKSSFTVSDFIDHLNAETISGGERPLTDSLPDELAEAREKSGHAFRTRIGKSFAKARDVVYPCGLLLKKAMTRAHGGSVAWLIKEGGRQTRQADLTESGEGVEGGEGNYSTPCEKHKCVNLPRVDESTPPPSTPSPGIHGGGK